MKKNWLNALMWLMVVTVAVGVPVIGNLVVQNPPVDEDNIPMFADTTGRQLADSHLSATQMAGGHYTNITDQSSFNFNATSFWFQSSSGIIRANLN
jgi:hypothetical protein